MKSKIVFVHKGRRKKTKVQLCSFSDLQEMKICGQFHAPAALLPENSPRYPLIRRLGGPKLGRDVLERIKIAHPVGYQPTILRSSSSQPSHESPLCCAEYKPLKLRITV